MADRIVARAVPAIIAIIALALFVWLGGRATKAMGGFLPGRGAAVVDHGVVVERTRAVARLVTSETTLRDVVIYQHRLLGSTKRSLVVVTGKVLSGFDLDRGTEVQVDHDAKVVRIVLPPAAVLGVEVTELRTYDEQRGLWNPFRPSDRDTIFRLAREQLARSAGEVELARHAEESARRLLTSLVSAEGYTTEVRFSEDRPGPKSSPLE